MEILIFFLESTRVEYVNHLNVICHDVTMSSFYLRASFPLRRFRSSYNFAILLTGEKIL